MTRHVWVKPNCWPQSLRIAPRTENPMPAAMSVKKLAQKRIFSFKPGEEGAEAGAVLTYWLRGRVQAFAHGDGASVATHTTGFQVKNR